MKDNLKKSLEDMENAANELLEKSQNSNPVQASVTASEKNADKDAASANGALSDGKEKAESGTLGKQDTSSFAKSTDAGPVLDAKKDKKCDENGSDISADKISSQVAKSCEVEKVEEIKKSQGIETANSVADALEVSAFLSEMTSSLNKSLDDLQKCINDSDESNQGALGTFAKSFLAIVDSQKALMDSNNTLGELVKSMNATIDSLSKRIEDIEEQPTMRKSVRDINVHSKDFSKSISSDKTELSKSQKLDIMNDLLRKGDTVVPMDIIGYETGSPLRPEVEEKINAVASNK